MPDTQPDAQPETLLIAEDDPLLMPLLKATFRNSGLRVITAGTGTQALDLARAERPNLVLLEVGLPEMNGYKVCRALKSDPQTSAHIMRTGGAHCSCPVLHTQRRRSGAL